MGQLSTGGEPLEIHLNRYPIFVLALVGGAVPPLSVNMHPPVDASTTPQLATLYLPTFLYASGYFSELASSPTGQWTPGATEPGYEGLCGFAALRITATSRFTPNLIAHASPTTYACTHNAFTRMRRAPLSLCHGRDSTPAENPFEGNFSLLVQ